MSLSYSKYRLAKPNDGTAYCPSCNDVTESDVMVPDNHDLPCFVICWNCRDVRQAGVGSLRDVELLDADGTSVESTLTGNKVENDRPKSSSQTCKWIYSDSWHDDGHYETSCGNAWQFFDGTIESNEISFCPYCGERISS